MCDATKVKSALCWGPQNVEGARTMGYLPRRVIRREWYRPQGKKYVAISRVGTLGPSKLFDIRSRVSGSGVCPAWVQSYFGLVLLSFLPVLPLRMVKSVLCQYLLEVCTLLFAFDFSGGDCLELQMRLGTFKQC